MLRSSLKMFASAAILLGYFLVFFMPFSIPKSVTRGEKKNAVVGSPEHWGSRTLPTKREVLRHLAFQRIEIDKDTKTTSSNRIIAEAVSGILSGCGWLDEKGRFALHFLFFIRI